MFGYVTANLSKLSQEQRLRYRSCYCGVCEAIKQRHSSLSRMALTYDMAFLVLLLNALYEPEEQKRIGRCVAHPMKAHLSSTSVYSFYAADMNVALAYYNCMDDWYDDHSVSALLKARTLRGAIDRIEEEYPRQIAALKNCIAELREVERSRDPNPDDGANSFGRLMGELFVCHQDHWSDTLRALGMELGKFIYLMDACLDLEKDQKRGVYNPIAAMPALDREAALTMLISDCAREFEKLPIVQDADILRNIIYSGVWTRYMMAEEKHK